MKLKNFLVKAKVATYASVGEINEKTLEDGCKELLYKESEFVYRDRYYGNNPFSGQEIVWQNGKIIWSMNYYGATISDDISVEQVYDFLKKALRKIRAERPFRGLDSFQEGEFKYFDKSVGNVEDFFGDEKILFQGQEVYRLKYHGGLIKMK